jgi:hypothetical protein
MALWQSSRGLRAPASAQVDAKCSIAAPVIGRRALQQRPGSLQPLQSAAMEEASSVDAEKRDIQQMLNRPYKYGFQTFIDSETFPKGLDETVVRAISAKKNEPEWMLEFRLRAFKKWLTMEPPVWSDNEHPPIDFQDYRCAMGMAL